jgi:hypothetical protein
VIGLTLKECMQLSLWCVAYVKTYNGQTYTARTDTEQGGRVLSEKDDERPREQSKIESMLKSLSS